MLFNPKTKKIFSVIGIIVIAGLGTYLLTHSFAGTGTVTSDCGSTSVKNYSYSVPFGNAVWNQKVCNLPKYSKSDDYADRFYKWSTLNDGSAEQAYLRGRLGLGLNFAKPTPLDPEGTKGIWSRNVYSSKDATTTTKVHSHRWTSNLDGTRWNSTPLEAKPGYSSNNPETAIPWNPAWRTGQAGDNEIVILDESNGRIYEIWGYWREDFDRVAKCGVLLAADRICAMSVDIGRDIDGNIIDYRTFEGLHGDRGVGFSKLITFTRPQEIAAGEIRHALGIAMPNTMYGPPCTASQLGTSAEGKTCGVALAPAAKMEYPNEDKPSYLRAPYNQTYTLDKTVPEGTRFALNMSNQEIEAWISSQDRFKNNPQLANSARIFAVALRDYGFMVVDTSGNGAGIQVAGTENPEDKVLWNQLGFKTDSDGSQLLRGLIKEDNLYVVEPPTVTCKDGTKSKYYCAWRSAAYDLTSQPLPDTTPPTVSFVSPSNNSTVSGSTVLSINASDDKLISKIEIKIDGQIIKTFTDKPYEYILDTKTISNGSHTINAKAYDGSNNVKETSITIKVSNVVISPAPPPPPPPEFRPVCDFIGIKGEIDAQDLGHVIYYFNKGQPVDKGTKGDCSPIVDDPTGNPNPAMDKRGDGKVNLQDINMLINRWTAQ